jgi:hypothetical protein
MPDSNFDFKLIKLIVKRISNLFNWIFQIFQNSANELIADILKDVDLLMNELQWIDAARKDSRLSKVSIEGVNNSKYDFS